MAHVIARQAGYDVLEINARSSDDYLMMALFKRSL